MTVYDLKLHERMTLLTDTTSYYITRVPGGWLYREFNTFTATFVPFTPNLKDN